MAGLTTHALDIMHGRPAVGMRIDLAVLEGDAWRPLGSTVTNAQGRTDKPLLDPGAVAKGRYELVFHVGAYFAALGVDSGEPAFLDQVPIRFAIAHTDEHYHVPLLVSPWSYSTYRGS